MTKMKTNVLKIDNKFIQIHQKLTKKNINELLFSFVSIFLNYLRRFGPKPLGE